MTDITNIYNEVHNDYYRHHPLIINGIYLLRNGGKCNEDDADTRMCNSNSCILFGDCNKKWNNIRVIKKRMMKLMDISSDELEEFIFDITL